jgi:hypothetical protein
MMIASAVHIAFTTSKGLGVGNTEGWNEGVKEHAKYTQVHSSAVKQSQLIHHSLKATVGSVEQFLQRGGELGALGGIV